jgi:hypothetical protein
MNAFIDVYLSSPSPELVLHNEPLGSGWHPCELALGSLRVCEEGRPRALAHLVGKDLLVRRRAGDCRGYHRGAQGGSISVMQSNVYLHDVLDPWFERLVQPRLRGEAYLGRYIDDFVLCFQYRADALRVQDVLRQRLGKFGLTLEPTKTKPVECGRCVSRWASKRGRRRPETIYFLGFSVLQEHADKEFNVN